MENAADALKMAAEVLLFILALGITISSFSQARETSEILLRYTDRDYVTQYVEDLETTERVVGIETIIPTIYRAYKENYKIYFYDVNGNPLELYKIKNAQTGAITSINAIDLTQDVLGDDWQKDNFIMALLYGKEAVTTKSLLKDKYGQTISWEDFNTSLNTGNSIIDLNEDGIYGIISSSKFKEYFGVYYPSQAREGAGEGEEENTNAQTTTEQKMRVISYQKYSG